MPNMVFSCSVYLILVSFAVLLMYLLLTRLVTAEEKMHTVITETKAHAMLTDLKAMI